MKGLLANDFALMRQRMKIMLFLIVWGIIMVFVMENGAFVVGWMVMIATITSISTISYDEYDNCMPFLMSLPVTRRTYAVEKYLFSMLFGTGSWLLSVLIVAVFGRFGGKSFSPAEDLPMLITFLALMLVIVAVSIPPQLKWGAEKGRTVLLILYAMVFAVFFLVGKLGGIKASVGKMDALSPSSVVIPFFAAGLILLAVSVMLSIRIMEKKEF